MRSGQPGGAGVATRLLVANQGQDYVAGEAGLLLVSADERVHHHGDAAFHVQGAAPPDVVILQAALEGRDIPGLRGSGHDVDVAIKQQGRRIASAGQAAEHVETVGIFAHQLGGNAGIGEDIPAVSGACGFVAGRVGGIEAD